MIQVNYEEYKLLAKQISYNTDLEVYRYSRLSMKLIFTLKKNHFEMMRYRYRKHLLPDMARD